MLHGVAVAVLVTAATGHAQARPAGQASVDAIALDLPAASVRDQVIALGRIARVSIVVPDAGLWSRRVPALRGRLSVEAAIAAIAARADARADMIAPGNWRLVRRVPPPPSARRRAPSLPPAEPPPATDIVVTASKRDTTRSNFAGQADSVSGRDLELGGAGGTERLAQRLTSITSTHLGAGRNKLFIRGIADSSFTGPTQATVGQYYGDLRLSYNAPDPDLRLSDLAAVEVLEGPQGTLYGAGSLGGIIRLVPNAPDLERTTGSVALGGSATTHGKPGADAQVVLNLPVVSDRLALRVVANAASEGGYIDKPALGRVDVNRTRITGGRATAHLDLGGDWNAELIGINQRIRSADSQYADRDGPPLTRSAPVTEGSEADFTQAQLVLSGMLGDVHLRSTSGITAHDLTERYDATAPGQPARLFAQNNRTRMQANETRLWQAASDGSGWLAGFSYIHNRTRLLRLYGAPDALRPTTGVINGVEETTLYGEASVRPFARVLTTGGFRITRSAIDGTGADVPLSLAPSLVAETASRAQTIVLPSASALFDVTRGAKLFVRYQQGFRPGGLAIEGEGVRQFRNDRVATIEVGGRLGDPAVDAIDASFTVAHASWRNIQADFIDGNGFPSTANIGDGRLWTIEGVVGARPFPGLRIEAAMSYNDGRIEEPSDALYKIAALPDASPSISRAEILARLRQIPNIAGITARGGATYKRQLGDGIDLTIDGWTRYVGSSRLGVGPVLGQRQGSYLDTGIVARLGLRGLGISASVSNIADARGNRFALGTPFTTGRDQITPLRPRTLRIGLDSAF